MKNNSQTDDKANRENIPFRIVILGGGTAGWMAANLFAKQWGKRRATITLIESPDVGIIGVGEGSTPTLKRFFKKMDISDKDWMPKCNATYKVSIKFQGWSPKSGITSYGHPFTSQVDSFTTRAFMLNCRTRCLGLDTHTQPEDFLLNGVLASQNKIPIAPSNFPFITEYGYHFDSNLLGQYLSGVAVELGVNFRQEHIVSVHRNTNGDVESLETKEGEKIEGDLFVDCSGFSSVLMQKSLGVKLKDYKENLFNDSAIVMPTEMSERTPVETVSTCLSAGWSWKIPLANRFGNGYVYSSDFITSNKAETEFRIHLNQLESNEECRHLKMRVGRLEEQWVNNCLGLGLSQGFIEPLEATALHLVQICIEKFISTFESGDFTDKNRSAYNCDIAQRFDGVRDYIFAHYKLNTRDDSDYWIANRDNQNISDSLAKILNVWYQREDLLAEIERQNISQHFDPISWYCLLAGYGAFPMLANNQPANGDQYVERDIALFLNGCSENFKSD
ncbi:MAG: tryptophan 7-halogenase [Kangiellaceae bacterium]|nr:tryptophan 7-halogenase [Kangiellaceae bacterium]